MQALHLLALEPIAETTGDPNSYGFRPARSTADAIGHLHQVLSLPTGAEWILEGDIRSCFDHAW
jgi:RNA-directed DNA polymerase